MLETDADRLGLIQSLGGLRVVSPAGDLWGVFDNAQEPATFDDGTVMAAGPQLSVRASDVLALGIKAGTELQVDVATYRVARLQRDGAGMTVLLLEDV